MNRSELFERYQLTRRITEQLISPLEVEDTVVQPIMDVSPPKWHLGHTSWFFETFLLAPYLTNFRPFHPKYSFIFNSYYDHVGQRVERAKRGLLSRPTLKDILDYRKSTDQGICHLISGVSEDDWQDVAKLTELGLNHEQQHQELLLTDIKYILGHNPLFPAYIESNTSRSNHDSNDALTQPEFIEIPGGVYTIGHQSEDFHFDNESPSHEVLISDLKLQNRLVTNKAYLEFIHDGGYQDFRHWLSDGWDTLKKNKWCSPLYWHNFDGEWFEYTLHGLQPLALSAPICHISFYEAEAFASWAGKRLPTEAEWEISAKNLPDAFSNSGRFLENGHYHPQMISSDSTLELHQMFGDVWEWSASSYLPYPGYRHSADALGEYNGKFMINQMVLKGGSCVTPKDHIRTSYRNFFHPDKRWQFSGMRLAESF